MKDERYREQVDAPELGASVFLCEISVGELLPLFEIAQKGDTAALMLACLASSLEVDGKRVTDAQLRGVGARKFKALMRIGPRALRINSILPDEEVEAEEKAGEKKG